MLVSTRLVKIEELVKHFLPLEALDDDLLNVHFLRCRGKIKKNKGSILASPQITRHQYEYLTGPSNQLARVLTTNLESAENALRSL